jgi:hypothetical protein
MRGIGLKLCIFWGQYWGLNSGLWTGCTGTLLLETYL